MSSSPAFTISGYSTARYATWFFIDELGLLLDAGDGLISGLMSKAAKIKHIAVSHPDRDHLSGLLHFLRLFGGQGTPTIYYPESSGSFPALAEFSQRFDPDQPGRPAWTPIASGAEIALGSGLTLRAHANRHVPCEPGQTKSVSFSLLRIIRKLKPEHRQLTGPEIGALKKSLGEAAITDEVEHTELIYTADTPIEPASRWGPTKILIHECTFLDAATAESKHQIARHSYLDAVLDIAAELQPQHLILTHFSARYGADEIREAIRAGATKRQLGLPIHAVLPGETVHDILGQVPVYAPS